MLPKRTAVILVGTHDWFEQMRKELELISDAWVLRVPTLHDLLFTLEWLHSYGGGRCLEDPCSFLVIVGTTNEGGRKLEKGGGLEPLCKCLGFSEITLQLPPKGQASSADGFCSLVGPSGAKVTEATTYASAVSLVMGALKLPAGPDTTPSPSSP